MLLDHAPDTQTFNDVGANSRDFHDGPHFLQSHGLLLILAKELYPGTIAENGPCSLVQH